MTLSTGKGVQAIWAVVGAASVAVCLSGAVRLTDTGPIAWIPYSPERLERAFKERQAVVMIFTAEWCLNCKALEQSVWGDPQLGRLVSEPSELPMRVDLTGSSPEGRKKLQEAGSLTIPLLVVYQPDGQPVLKSDFYTANQAAEAIRLALAARPPKP
jgi:thiol:disulfide interchange protein